MFIYGLINKFQTRIAKADTDRSYSLERVEDVYVGTGVGRKTLEQMCNIAVLDNRKELHLTTAVRAYERIHFADPGIHLDTRGFRRRCDGRYVLVSCCRRVDKL